MTYLALRIELFLQARRTRWCRTRFFLNEGYIRTTFTTHTILEPSRPHFETWATRRGALGPITPFGGFANGVVKGLQPTVVRLFFAPEAWWFAIVILQLTMRKLKRRSRDFVWKIMTLFEVLTGILEWTRHTSLWKLTVGCTSTSPLFLASCRIWSSSSDPCHKIPSNLTMVCTLWSDIQLQNSTEIISTTKRYCGRDGNQSGNSENYQALEIGMYTGNFFFCSL